MSDLFYLVVILMLFACIVCLQAQANLTRQRIDILWDYCRSLNRSLESQHRISKMHAQILGIAPMKSDEEKTKETA